MTNKRYAVVVRVRMQVTGYVKNPEIVNLQNNIVVDLENHPQKDEVDVDWFYNEETNTFSKEGEVQYPEPEEVISDKVLTAQEEMAIDAALNVEYAVCLLEASMGL